MQERHRWLVEDEHGNVLSPSYYSGGAAMRLARRLSNERRCTLVVTRDGRVWQTYAPEPTPESD